MDPNSQLHPAFRHSYYLFRRKVFRIFGGFFHVYDESGNVALYSEQASFKLREDFTVYTGDTKEAVLKIKTPHILDVGATYEITDPRNMEVAGSLRRRFLKSIFKDEWTILSPDGQTIGKVVETDIIGAFLSRWINLVPQKYTVYTESGQPVAAIKQHFNPFVLKYSMTLLEPEPPLNRRLIVAAGILLAAIERRQR
ncbi:MAG: hypothetical protein R6U89_01135 [Dehalococcoidia bacterium]